MTRERILIVDDDRAARDHMARALLSEGFDVEAADNPEAALDLLAEQPAELLLADAELPGRDGVSLARWVKAEHPHMALIGIADGSNAHSAVEFLKANADDYLRKPLPVPRLIASVESALDRRAAKLGLGRDRRQPMERTRAADVAPAEPLRGDPPGLADGVPGAEALADLQDQVGRLWESLSLAAKTRDVEAIVSEACARLSEEVDRLKASVPSEPSVCEALSGDVAALREEFEKEMAQLWSRMAELKWDLGPETAERPTGRRPEPSPPSLTRLIVQETPDADDLDSQTFIGGAAKYRSISEASRSGSSHAPVAPAARSVPDSRSAVAQDDAQGEESAAVAPQPEEEGAERAAALRAAAVDALSDLLVSIREETDVDVDRAWEGALPLLPAMEEDAHAFLALVMRPYGANGVAGHSVNVLLLVLQAAGSMSLPPGDRVTLAQAALFHDIGMMRLPREIVEGTRPATREEQREAQRYPEYSAEILAGAGDPLLCSVVRQSREWEDGSGQPLGLAGSDIHPLAKLIHVADAFDAIVHTRDRSRPLRPSEAMDALRQGAGRSFSEGVVDHFCRAVGPLLVGAASQ